MTHRFPIKEIARQAGLGTATVDRVLNNRSHVSPQTRNRVAAALRELEAQEAQLVAKGRRIILDVLAESPKRFSREIRLAAESAVGSIPSAAIRLRFQFQEVMTEAETIAALNRIANRGSHGLCLKARDTPAVRDAIGRLAAARIPVFTLVTDLPLTARQGYFGLNNAQAGRTAAYLMAQSLPALKGTVLMSRSQDSFRGETDRYTAFCDLITTLRPGVRLMDVSGGAGVTATTAQRLQSVLATGASVTAVYSMGGGNAAILRVLAAHGQTPAVFVAHDLDRENRHLLAVGAIQYVLHHDLEKDMRTLLGAALGGFKSMPAVRNVASSAVQIITPFNLSDLSGGV
ncbi:LacI family DNA-binding transcriptional regulator [Yoonia sp.]|uniref:LacI family DNA-binding transcriptional regulator n=1 Tax=Yoonia sp. TaxID=2212373 RepID=UPI0019FACF3F|nr:LacI family DNA-binding transcriptional regulator [Yoonia sp.]MBE0414535.1 substrate-binding domain-containing protein [Yoonia sp.]